MTKAKTRTPVPASKTDRSTRLLGLITPVLPLVATGLASTAVTLLLVTSFGGNVRPLPNLAVFDVDAAMAQFVTLPEIAALASESDEFAAAVRSFHGKLDVELERFAASQSVVLLSANTVIAGRLPDVTTDLLNRALRGIGPLRGSKD